MSFCIVGRSWESFHSPQWLLWNAQLLIKAGKNEKGNERNNETNKWACFFDLRVTHPCVKVKRMMSNRLADILDQLAEVREM